MNGNLLRILQLNSMLRGGGTDNQCLCLTAALRSIGHQTWLAGPADRELMGRVREWEIPFVPLSAQKISFVWQAARFIRREKIQILHAHHGRDYWPAVIAAYLAGTKPKIILTRHLAKSPGSAVSKRFLLDQCDAFIAVSQFVARVLREGVNEPNSPEQERRVRPPMRGDHGKIHVIYGGIDTDRFHPFAALAQRVVWHLEPHHFVFAVIGAYDFPRGKGQPEYLQAAAQIQRQIPHARFLLIGRGNMREFLEAEIRRLGLAGKAWLAPYSHDMPTAMNAIDCLVHPAQGTEAFGLVVAEAFACGKPVIATNLDAIPEAFALGQAGQLIDSVAAPALAQAMLAIHASGRLTATRQTELHATIAERFSLKNFAHQHDALYRRLL